MARMAVALWVACGVAAVVVVLIEAALERGEQNADLFTRAALAPSFPELGEAEIDEFVAEANATATMNPRQLDWQPFTYWKSKPRAGRFINIDNAGLRATWNPPAADSAAPRPRVFFFGGSAMWGHGNRDEHTIPSLVSKRLADTGAPIEAVNFAQLAYVSTQDVFTLLRQLEHGNVPAVAVFMNGFNDVSSSYLNRRPGETILESNYREEARLREPALLLVGRALRNTAIGRLLGGGLEPARQSLLARPKLPPEQVVAETLAIYLGNVRIAESARKGFGFACLHAWQPNLFARQSPTEFERRQLVEHEKLRPVYLAADARARALVESSRRSDVANAPRMIDLNDLFNAPAWSGRDAFIDRCHLTEAGAAAVAESLSAEIHALLPRAEEPAAAGAAVPR